MQKAAFLSLWTLIFMAITSASLAKELPKIAVWDLVPRDVKLSYAQELTSILVSEISRLEQYEVYSQENVRTIAGWTAERMKLGCTDTQCLIALGQMNIAELVSGSVGKIGNRYSVSLNLFDTQNAKAVNAVSEFGHSEDELIDLVQRAARHLLRIFTTEELSGEKETAALPEPEKSFKEPVTGMEFVFIKGGCYEMGDTFGDGDKEEKPVHEVCIDDFYLGKYEVTQGQWEKMMGDNPSEFKEKDNPVEQVSWNDVQEYIERLNLQSGRKYRLPSEAEWEYAARSGGKKEKYAGTSQEGELGQYAWYNNNSGSRTHPVGQKNPNGLGLYDMSGNVWEWCSDSYDENYYKISHKDNPGGPFVDPMETGVILRTLRGGAWNCPPKKVRAAYRFGGGPAYRYRLNGVGFRLGLFPR